MNNQNGTFSPSTSYNFNPISSALSAFGLLSVLCFSIAPASATTVTFTPGGANCGGPAAGLCSLVPGAQTITFDGLNASTPAPYISGIATYTFSGNSPFVTGSLPGEFAAPPNDSTTYLSVGSPGKAVSATITFAAGINYFGFYLGSPDDYNNVTFLQAGNVIGSFTGDKLIPPGGGNQSLGAYLNFSSVGGNIDQIVLTSSSAALETDNHAYVQAASETPEPSSIALAGLGLLGFGSLLRRKRV